MSNGSQHGLVLLVVAATALPTIMTLAADGVKPSAALVAPDGAVSTAPFQVPLSRYMSEEAQRAFIDAASKPQPAGLNWDFAAIADVRKAHDDQVAPMLARARALYPVEIAERVIANVRTRVVTPKQRIPMQHRDRVLLNLHGGGFFMGANGEALLESVPVAVVAATKVITVDYRQAPEHQFPAASEDVVAVYRALLQELPAQNIGVYGCSAGGILTAMTVAALQKQNLPRPGAIGIFSAGAYADWNGDPAAKGSWGGDSRYWAGPLSGQAGLPAQWTAAPESITRAYIRDADPGDPLLSPGESFTTLAKFPPALLLTGTRAYDLSAVVQTHRQLVKSGAEANLHLWDGLGHCFFFDVDLPESKEAYEVMARFFESHLGKRQQGARMAATPSRRHRSPSISAKTARH